jgi:hypothetical protein
MPLCHRLSLFSRVRALRRYPREDDRIAVERDRDSLREQIRVFSTMQDRLMVRSVGTVGYDDEAYVAPFEEVDDTEILTTAVHGGSGDAVMQPPESTQLPLPSALLDTSSPLRAIELTLRQQQADLILEEIRQSIAQKSFLYSHVMRVAPRKEVRTRSHAAVRKISGTITAASAAYCKCRVALERLEAPLAVLQKYKILNRKDTVASTAIQNPNIPGSSELRLSWIWQTGNLGTTPASTMLECMFLSDVLKTWITMLI